MSEDNILRLFPSSTNLVKTHLPALWNQLFPHLSSSSREKCAMKPIAFDISTLIPEQHHTILYTLLGHTPNSTNSLKNFPVRSPLLLVLALVGLGLGLQGFVMIRQDLWTWRRVFLWYSGMNLGAVVCHCLTVLGSKEWEVGWALDVASTGSIAINMILAVIYQRHPERRGRRFSTQQLDQQEFIVNIASLVLTLALFMAAYYGISQKVPFTAELIYIVLIVVAAGVFGWTLVIPVLVNPQSTPQVNLVGKLALLSCAGSVLLGALGIPLDRRICEWVNTRTGSRDFLATVSFLDVFFAGCLVGMQFLMVYVLFGVV
ncbi:hypothetical protein BDR26DRAFT_853837, partial [Obelidium mucronatum]